MATAEELLTKMGEFKVFLRVDVFHSIDFITDGAQIAVTA